MILAKQFLFYPFSFEMNQRYLKSHRNGKIPRDIISHSHLKFTDYSICHSWLCWQKPLREKTVCVNSDTTMTEAQRLLSDTSQAVECHLHCTLSINNTYCQRNFQVQELFLIESIISHFIFFYFVLSEPNIQCFKQPVSWNK